MPAQAGPGHIHGFYHAQVMSLNTSNYIMGNDTTPNAVTAGQTSHAHKLTGPVTATAFNPTRDTAIFRGGMSILGQKAAGISEMGSFDLTLSAHDEMFETWANNSAPDLTNFGTENIATAYNILGTNFPSLALALTVGWQTLDGINRFKHWLYPSVMIFPPGFAITSEGGVNPNPAAYTVVPTVSPRTLHGYLFKDTTLKVAEGRDLVYSVRTANPIAFTTYIDDGSATSFNLGYLPVWTEHAGAYNSFTKNGVIGHTGVSGVSDTTGAVTITAGSANDIWIAAYETNFVLAV